MRSPKWKFVGVAVLPVYLIPSSHGRKNLGAPASRRRGGGVVEYWSYGQKLPASSNSPATPALPDTSVSYMQRPDDTIHDQANEFLLAGVVPAQMLAAVAAVTERPGIPWKPRVFESGLSRRPAAQGLHERNNLKPKPRGVSEREFVFTTVLESILLVRDPIKAQCA